LPSDSSSAGSVASAGATISHPGASTTAAVGEPVTTAASSGAAGEAPTHAGPASPRRGESTKSRGSAVGAPAASTRPSPADAQLPGGGQVLFPGHRLVALYGSPGISGLGALGQQDLRASIARVKQIAAPYQRLSDVPVVPTFEIIATVAAQAAGEDGDYSDASDVSRLRTWVKAATAAGLYVVLDLQPGRSDFLSQAKLYTDLLKLPQVGLALDPEWRLAPDQKPLEQIGGVDAQEINSVITWLADLTKANHLPQKLLVLHQFKLSMIRSEHSLNLSRQQVAVLIHMDGQGTPELKDETWAAVTAAAPPGIAFGWKNFYRNDTPIVSPAETMRKKPTPLMISYE
jgi:hypothetical protein